MSADFIFRLIGMVLFAVLGTFWGNSLGQIANAHPAPEPCQSNNIHLPWVSWEHWLD